MGTQSMRAGMWGLGAQGLYNICSPPAPPLPGDLVFFVGTYDTLGLAIVGCMWMAGCSIVEIPSVMPTWNSSYWQSHFYAYGRLP